MQIKRFEADDMTEALRLVKREFGDDAVILSAKEMRPGGFFSSWRKKQVEITAAADYPQEDDEARHSFSEQLSQQLDTESENDRVSLSVPTHRFKSLHTVGPSLPHPYQPPHVSGAPLSTAGGREREQHRSTEPTPSVEVAQRPAAVGMDAVSWETMDSHRRAEDTNNLTTEPFYRNRDAQQIIAFVGPHGAGKSTIVAKLARYCSTFENQRVGLISLDRFTMGSNSLLEKMAHIMDIPFAVARDGGDLQRVVDDYAGIDVILIDTPGMGGRPAPSMGDDIRDLLRTARPDETHLVVNATVRQAVLDHAVETFSPMGIDRLLFTHMDEYDVDESIVRMIETHRLPSSFYSDGVDLFDHLQETTADRLRHFAGQTEPAQDHAVANENRIGNGMVRDSERHRNERGRRFVANRNSELFHHPECKSVKRINVENITAFDSIEQALDEGFKPCRACCNVEMVRNAAAGVFGHQRLRAS
jgi:flagellar biosynthesis protein FlhF